MHGNDKVLITFSCGVAELNGEEMPYDALKRADDALYAAKAQGRNRVCEMDGHGVIRCAPPLGEDAA